MTIYNTEITNIGSEAEMFKAENMMILFGKDAPADLADYSYNIEVNPLEGSIQEGMKINIGDNSYQITAVGNVVEKNLADLGHITLKFDGSTEPELAGTLYLEEAELPEVTVGTKISINE